jgi:hypothetical protein
VLKNVYGEECLPITSVFERYIRFKGVSESLQGDEQKAFLQFFRTKESLEVIQKWFTED